MLQTYIYKIISFSLDTYNGFKKLEICFYVCDITRNRTQNHQNFGPITLQSVWQKFTHLLFLFAHTTFLQKWLYQNENAKADLERHIWNNWAYRITELHHQPSKQETTVTLSDLKIAFGKVDRQLMLKALEYNHLTAKIKH